MDINSLLVSVIFFIVLLMILNRLLDSNIEHGRQGPVQHKKKDFLATESERKLYFALQQALDSSYVIHSQVSLIALVEPVNFKDVSKSWAKRMDFVITDKSTKVIAVIELDDSSHNAPKRKKRDLYVNNALEGHHPLIRMKTQKYYHPKAIAALLEREAGITNTFTSNP